MLKNIPRFNFLSLMSYSPIFFNINLAYLIQIRETIKMGEGGFEPPATWSQTRNHTKLDHPPIKFVEEIDNLCFRYEK